MTTLCRWIFHLTLSPLWLGLIDKNYRGHVFTKNFSGHGVFFNRFAKGRYLPLWASVIYHLWVRPSEQYRREVSMRTPRLKA